MPSDPTAQALVEIRDNVLLAQSFTAGMSQNAFTADVRTFYAVTRCLEIISEAARRLPPDLRERYPDQPWRAIMGAGNVYRHNYDNVAEVFVWRTVQHSLEPLQEVVETELARLSEGK
jgi:uncharacterized protein with HEPN domain